MQEDRIIWSHLLRKFLMDNFIFVQWNVTVNLLQQMFSNRLEDPGGEGGGGGVGIWGGIGECSEIGRDKKSLVSTFARFSTVIVKLWILGRRLGTGLFLGS